jgi:hypothetical protein
VVNEIGQIVSEKERIERKTEREEASKWLKEKTDCARLKMRSSSIENAKLLNLQMIP